MSGNLTPLDSSTWLLDAQLTSVSGSCELTTNGKYIDRNIMVQVSVPGVILANGDTFYIEGPDGTRFNWVCDSTTGAITIEEA